MNYLKQIENALEHAKAKHPFFAHEPLPTLPSEYTRKRLAQDRKWLSRAIEAKNVTGLDVLNCEVSEALDTYARGNLEHCLEELAQCAAVIVRVMEGVENER